jgi:hypothetical protein
MKGVNCIGLFCEDIREEKNGAFTIIGIMPDNVTTEVVNVAPTGEARPGAHVTMMSKICIYTRINFDPAIDLPEGELRLVPVPGDAIQLGKIDRAVIEKAKKEAKDMGHFMAGIVLRAEMGGYPIPPKGALKMEVSFPEETILAAALHFKPKIAEATSPSEPPLPS